MVRIRPRACLHLDERDDFVERIECHDVDFITPETHVAAEHRHAAPAQVPDGLRLSQGPYEESR